jgi:hypothetical protein
MCKRQGPAGPIVFDVVTHDVKVDQFRRQNAIRTGVCEIKGKSKRQRGTKEKRDTARADEQAVRVSICGECVELSASNTLRREHHS